MGIEKENFDKAYKLTNKIIDEMKNISDEEVLYAKRSYITSYMELQDKITNVIGSSITREADYSIYTHAGPEIAVASTKAYTSQITLLILLAIYFAQVLESMDELERKNILQELLDLPSKVEQVLKQADNVKEISKKLCKEKDVFFIGRGIDYTTAQEASLKLKEISYIHSESYAAG